MKTHQLEMTSTGFDCFALIADVVADPYQQQRERDAARRIIENMKAATIELPIFEAVKGKQP